MVGAMSTRPDFADYCCELLSSVGPCQGRRMFGGYGISTAGLTFAIVVDLGDGDTLWLKADADTRGTYEAEGCRRFTYDVTRDGQPASRGMNYYSAPPEAMDSPQLMQPWAQLALDCALKARAARPVRARSATKTTAKAPAAPRKAAAAPAKKPRAPRASRA